MVSSRLLSQVLSSPDSGIQNPSSTFCPLQLFDPCSDKICLDGQSLNGGQSRYPNCSDTETLVYFQYSVIETKMSCNDGQSRQNNHQKLLRRTSSKSSTKLVLEVLVLRYWILKRDKISRIRLCLKIFIEVKFNIIIESTFIPTLIT